MAVAHELVEIGGAKFVRSYSTEGYTLEDDGQYFMEIYDPLGTSCNYTETKTRSTTSIKNNPRR